MPTLGSDLCHPFQICSSKMMPCPLTPLFPLNPVLQLYWVSKTSRKPWITSKILAARESGKCGFQISSLCSTRRNLGKGWDRYWASWTSSISHTNLTWWCLPSNSLLCDFAWAVLLPKTICVHHRALPLHVQLSEIGRDHPLSGPHQQPVLSS